MKGRKGAQGLKRTKGMVRTKGDEGDSGEEAGEGKGDEEGGTYHNLLSILRLWSMSHFHLIPRLFHSRGLDGLPVLRRVVQDCAYRV